MPLKVPDTLIYRVGTQSREGLYVSDTQGSPRTAQLCCDLIKSQTVDKVTKTRGTAWQVEHGKGPSFKAIPSTSTPMHFRNTSENPEGEGPLEACL